jgi:uncharacterized membrane protein YfbV (UPF0208 family)
MAFLVEHSLGLRGEMLARYARAWIIEIEDISAFVAEQRVHAHGDYAQLLVPRERVYLMTWQSQIGPRAAMQAAGRECRSGV